MKRSTRMMLMSSGSNRRYNDGRSYENYDVDDKFRDRRGREHYDNGRYAPRSEMMEPNDRGYRRYSDGRFAPRNDGGTWVESNYWDDRMTGPQSHYGYPYYMPPAYTDRREMTRPMNKIGFAILIHGPSHLLIPCSHSHRTANGFFPTFGRGQLFRQLGHGLKLCFPCCLVLLSIVPGGLSDIFAH